MRHYCKHIVFTAVLLFATFTASRGQEENWTTIRNGIEWTDTEGYIVQAHGGNFLEHDGRWYLVGEDRGRSWNPDVNLYSTDDFVTWKFEGKIIKNFVTHEALGNTRMIEITLDISHSLSVPMIAEGVETEEQMLTLRKLGCDIVQGYYFAKPMPAEEFVSFLKE